jgi:hypothetical protein
MLRMTIIEKEGTLLSQERTILIVQEQFGMQSLRKNERLKLLRRKLEGTASKSTKGLNRTTNLNAQRPRVSMEQLDKSI